MAWDLFLGMLLVDLACIFLSSYREHSTYLRNTDAPDWCVCVCECVCMLSHVWFFVTSWTVAHHGTVALLCPWNFSGKNTGACCHFLFQGIFPTRGSNPCLWIPCTGRQILDHWATWEVPSDQYHTVQGSSGEEEKQFCISADSLADSVMLAESIIFHARNWLLSQLTFLKQECNQGPWEGEGNRYYAS